MELDYWCSHWFSPTNRLAERGAIYTFNAQIFQGENEIRKTSDLCVRCHLDLSYDAIVHFTMIFVHSDTIRRNEKITRTPRAEKVHENLNLFYLLLFVFFRLRLYRYS